jgi:hypothetical protein
MSIVGTQGMAGIPPQAALVQNHNNRGNLFFNQGQYRDAIQEFGKALGTSIE